MTTILYDNQFERVENLLNQMHYPFQGTIDYAYLMYASIKLNFNIYSMIKKIRKEMENNVDHKDAFITMLEKIKKLRDTLYDLDEKLEEYNISGIIHYNVHSSLTRLDDLAEDLEIFVDDEIRELGEKIAHSL